MEKSLASNKNNSRQNLNEVKSWRRIRWISKVFGILSAGLFLLIFVGFSLSCEDKAGALSSQRTVASLWAELNKQDELKQQQKYQQEVAEQKVNQLPCYQQKLELLLTLSVISLMMLAFYFLAKRFAHNMLLKKTSLQRFSVSLLSITAITFLLVAVGSLSDGYYSFLRLIITAIAAYFVYVSYTNNKTSKIPLIFSAVAVLYNPFIVLDISKGAWVFVDVVVIGVFIIGSIKLRKNLSKANKIEPSNK